MAWPKAAAPIPANVIWHNEICPETRTSRASETKITPNPRALA